MAKRFRNARALESLFQAILVTTGAAAVCAMCLSSCGGKTLGDDEFATDPDGGGTSADANPCRVVARNDAGAPWPSCAYWTVTLSSAATPEACGLPDSGRAWGRACESLCGPAVPGESLLCTMSGATVSCNYACVVDGRRPPCLDDAPARGASVGAWLATMAFHEAASVDAFAILGDELRAHGAPRSLLRSIERARRDEVRHARSARALAQRHGAATRKPNVRRPLVRELETIALENAREGCGRETIGALVGLYQATHASTAELREFYASIARDELRHASLSWRMHAWMMEKLPRRARVRVEAELANALRSFGVEAPRELRATLGLPNDEHLRALAHSVALAVDTL